MTSLKHDENFTQSLDKTCELPWKVQALGATIAHFRTLKRQGKLPLVLREHGKSEKL